jgi:DNA (cytosine-5)-methyltransferase 1
LSHEKGDTFRTIISTLDEMGYDAEWQVLNSKYFVPQNRERVFIIGHLRGERTRQIFPVGDFNSETDKPKLKQIGNVDTKGHNSLWGRVYDPNGIAPNLNANGGGMGAKTGLYAVDTTMIAWSSSGRDGYRDERIKIGEANTLNTGDGCRTQSSATFVYMSNTNANMKQRIQDRKETWTLGTGTDFGIKDGMRIRKLTPIECERLQGFPDNWTQGSDTQRYKQCGNAVTVPVVEYIAKELRLG